ncbi:hypothetical protein ACOME3_005352 [Neoechinorhynchus agilis]
MDVGFNHNCKLLDLKTAKNLLVEQTELLKTLGKSSENELRSPFEHRVLRTVVPTPFCSLKRADISMAVRDTLTNCFSGSISHRQTNLLNVGTNKVLAFKLISIDFDTLQVADSGSALMIEAQIEIVQFVPSVGAVVAVKRKAVVLTFILTNDL